MVTFICRAFDDSAGQMVRRAGFEVESLPFSNDDTQAGRDLTGYCRWLGVEPDRDANETIRAMKAIDAVDWLIVDHYALDHFWESKMRPHVGKILAIDDIANRAHDCDVLVDQNHGHEDGRYTGLIPAQCQALVGAKYALLRDEFYRARQSSPERSGYIERILVFYGGVDSTNETCKAVSALAALDKLEPIVEAVIGAANRQTEEIAERVATLPNARVHTRVERMSELMITADLCLGAAGTTSWERCCLGLPTVMTAVAENQISIARAIDQAGAGAYLGTPELVTAEMLTETIEQLAISPRSLMGLSMCAKTLVDGLGAQRVAGVMLGAREAAVT